MRIINVLVYVLIGGFLLVTQVLFGEKNNVGEKCKTFLRTHWHLIVLLIVANTISFVMTFSWREEETFIQREGYGGKNQEIDLRLTKGEMQEEWQLSVAERKLTEDQLLTKIEEAFSYLENNVKGDNPSLSEVRSSLDYTFDYEQFPFDADFQSDKYFLIDEEGTLKNEKEELLALGYSEQDLESGIPVKLTITLWYGEQDFSREYELQVYPRQKTPLEQSLEMVKLQIQEAERTSIYEEGFYVPNSVGEVEVSLSQREGVTPGQVLMAGIIIVVLLILREQENEKKREQNRNNCLIRSYPWFVNELVLMMGAGMQIRNIFFLLVKEYEGRKETTDYRKPLMEELRAAVQALELGMSEEQVYYKLGRRLMLPCYMKIMTMLEQNVKRGGKGISTMFEQEELQALEERKNLAKRFGEEAGTKMLGPMIVVLLTIMLIIMLPAFWGFA